MMIPSWIWVLPLFLQGTLMSWDEMGFHRRRGLPLWERIGHPLDTISFLLCVAIPLFFSPNPSALRLYIGLSVFSCLLVTKDEFVHTERCTAGENWVHALLFILHPAALFAIGWAWVSQDSGVFRAVLSIELLAVAGFLAYQILYWRFAPNTEAAAPINNDFYDDLGDGWYTAQDHPVALLRAENRLRTPWVLSSIPARSKVLDIGCGAGFLSNELARAGHEVTGIDLSERSFAVARKFDSSKSVQYRAMDARKLDFPDASFDVVCAMDFLEHIEEWDQVISEVSRVLKPGGSFFFHTFNRNPLSKLVVIKGVEWFVKNTPPRMHVVDLFLKPQELEQHCRNHGLRVSEFKGVRPRFEKAAFWRMLGTGVVPKDFSFAFTRSTLVAYSGRAIKASSLSRSVPTDTRFQPGPYPSP